ncbi:MAG TPA: TonB family protein [Puia sp.]|nr:TonB family protein [Puia sp.]
METNKILDADILDLLFDGRNKEYGAYDLRRHYNGRLGRAIAVTSGLVVVLCSFTLVRGHGKVVAAPAVTDVVMEAVAEKTPPPVVPPPVVPKPQPVATIRFVTTRIVPNDQVKPDEVPPENKDLDNVKISTATKDGALDDGLAPGPASDGVDKGIVEKPKTDAGDDDRVFRSVEIESQYPGGKEAWARFLNKNLHFNDEAVEAGIQGTVLVQFIVDKEGNVSDVEAVSGPTEGGLREEAVRVIKKSGKWTPAIQNGRVVKSYKRQPVIFQIADQ